MVTQRFEFSATPGLTLTVKLFLRGSDVVVRSGVATQKAANASRYYIDFTDVPAGTYIMDGFIGSVGGYVAETFEVLLLDGLYVPNSELVRTVVTTGGGTVQDNSPVTSTGKLRAIIIGDDYLAANNRQFAWTVDAVTGFVPASVSAVFSLRATLPCGTYSTSVTGTVSDLGAGRWSVSVDLPAAATANLVEGDYDWSMSLLSAGVVITKIQNQGDTNRVKVYASLRN